MNVALRTYVDVKPVVTIVASMDLHVMGGGYYLRGATIAYNAVFRGGYYSRGATKQRECLFEEICYLFEYLPREMMRLLSVGAAWRVGSSAVYSTVLQIDFSHLTIPFSHALKAWPKMSMIIVFFGESVYMKYKQGCLCKHTSFISPLEGSVVYTQSGISC